MEKPLEGWGKLYFVSHMTSFPLELLSISFPVFCLFLCTCHYLVSMRTGLSKCHASRAPGRMVLNVSCLGIGAEITLELLTREGCEKSMD